MSTVTLANSTTHPVPRLDYELLRRVALWFGILNVGLAPWMQDGLAYAVGGCVPWLLLRIIGTPGMPAAAAYLFLWQWMQIFARVLLAQFDGESLSSGVYSSDVNLAYWYMLAGLVVMAGAFRLVLGGLAPPTRAAFTAHERWRPRDLIIVYFGAMAFSLAFALAGRAAPSLFQALDVASRIKVVALFLLCTYALTTGRGMSFMLAAVLFEIVVGFTGFFSDFRGVFIYVAVAAIAAGIKWTGKTSVAALMWLSLLIVLALFWTAVKNDYRIFASQSDESQEITVPLSERMRYLGDKADTADSIKWGDAAYTLLNRLGYVDIFGAVIGVRENNKEPELYRQWKEGLGHVFQPRFLFPDKAPLSDSEVFIRLARGDPNEEVRAGTSISVGYMGENYADFGFPGMLVGLFVLGAALGLIVCYFMRRDLPLMLREGIIMGFAFSMARDGVEVSLAKVLGGMFMFFVVFSVLAKFVFPLVIRWLDSQAAAAEARRVHAS